MKHFALLLLNFCFLFPAFGQIVTKDQVEKKAERKASQRIDRRIDQSMDRGLDAIENAVFNRSKRKIKEKGNEKIEEKLNEAVSNRTDSTDDNPYSGMFSGSANVKDQYNFSAKTDIKTIITDKKGKKEEMKYRMYFSGADPWFGMEMLEMTQKGVESMFMIFDMENNQLVSLTESNGQKMGFAMSFDPSAYNEVDEADTDSEVSFRKTGRTKTILGYTCEEYITESEDGSGSMWVTKEESLHIGFAMAAMGSMAGKEKNNQNLPKDYPKGALLEMDYLQKDGSKMFWTTEDIKLNISHNISTAGYQIMGMPGRK